MIELINLTLENEMDLVLAQKKASKLSEVIKLTISTQAIFVTAIAEISRVVIEFTDNGILSLGLKQENDRFSLVGIIKYVPTEGIKIPEENYHYARKLVPLFDISISEEITEVTISIQLPKSLNLNNKKVQLLMDFFESEPPISAYEEVKKKNLELFQIAEVKDQQLKQSKYIDEKRNEFISIASHELKTPITIIKAYTQLVLSGKENCSEYIKGILKKIDAQSTKLTNLVQQLLDTSKIENGRLEYNYKAISFNSYFDETSFLITHIIPEHKLTIELGPDIKVKIDKERMDQVFSNLISNAGKYSLPGSAILLRTSIDSRGDLIVSVTDEGIGMSEVNIEKIFEKFYRNKQVMNGYSGLGMGLYITSKIVTDHGGKIWVESVKDKGSTFYFSLPGEAVALEI